MEAKLIFVFLVIGTVKAQTDLSDNLLSNLPPEIQAQANDTMIKELQNKASPAFREKCEKNGAPEAFSQAEGASTAFMACIGALVDQKVLMKEIEDAKPKGQVDEVFKNYCARSPQFKGCFRNMTEAIKPCFSHSEQENLKIIYNVTEQLAEFVCFKEGDRIALFIAEGGPECLESKKVGIEACVNKTIGDNYKLDINNLSADSLPELSFGEKECSKMTELQHCMVSELETCEQPTSANILDSLFKFITKVTPCKKFVMTKHEKHSSHNILDDTAQASVPGAASGLAVTAATFLMALSAHLLV